MRLISPILVTLACASTLAQTTEEPPQAPSPPSEEASEVPAPPPPPDPAPPTPREPSNTRKAPPAPDAPVSAPQPQPKAPTPTEGESPSAPAPTPATTPAPASAEPSKAGIVNQSRDAMGTKLMISIWTEDEAGARAAIEAAFTELERLDRSMSVWEPNSDIARLNARAGQTAVTISPETLYVLRKGKAISKASSGSFALTWAALNDVWDFAPEGEPVVPGMDLVTSRLELIDDNLLILDEQAGTAQLARENMAVGIGGIAKGFAIDMALAVLHERGFNDALIFAGGDIRVSGRKGNRQWTIGIQDPRAAGYFAALPVRDAAVATSGDYETYFEITGQRYHHILDPRTGFPATGCRSVTIIAATGIEADALATAAFVLGPKEGMKLIEALENVEGVIVDTENGVEMSANLRHQLQIVRSPSN